MNDGSASLLGRFIRGLRIPLRSLKLILKNPPLFALSLLPAALTIGLFATAFQGFKTYLGELNSAGGRWQTFIAWMGQAIYLLAAAVAFNWIANLIAIPLNDLLAEHTEKRTHPSIHIPRPFTIRRYLRTVRIDLFKTILAGMLSVSALLISWIPLVNVLAFIFSCWILTFQFLCFPHTRRDMGILTSVSWMRRYAWECLGFGFVFFVLFLIPGFSSIVLPLAVVGGTLLFAECENRT